LAADLGDHPSAFHGDDGGHAADRSGHPEQSIGGEVAAAPPRPPSPQPGQQQQEAETNHGIEAQVKQPDDWRPVGGRHAIETGDRGVWPEPNEEGVHERDPQAAVDVASNVHPAEPFGHIPGGLRDVLHGGELDRLVMSDGAGRCVADKDLKGRQHRRRDEPQREAGVVIQVASTAQDAHGVDSCDAEPGDHVGGEDHVWHLVERGVIEQHLPGVNRNDATVLFGEAAGLVHPRIDRNHRHGAEDAADRYRYAAPKVCPTRQPPPSVQIDRREDGFEEEEDPFESEGESEHCAVPAHQAGPQQPHLEGEDGPRDDSHGDQHRHGLRPAVGEAHGGFVVAAQTDELGEQHERRQRDPEAGQNDVEPERGRHLGPSRKHLGVNLDGSRQRHAYILYGVGVTDITS
jgi:hypothetical protein